jgi:hypothetical protein
MVKRPASADRAKQRGWGQTRGCFTLLARRRSSPRQQTQKKLDGGHGTDDGAPQVRAHCERKELGCLAEGTTE